MNPFRMNVCLLLLFCMSARAFPTESATKTSSGEAKDATSSTETASSKSSQPLNPSSISTTSSLLFKDKKPILTYLLGQPKKQGSVSSPAQLLSPDRYEFFTFDDDGQIVKKLMSVKEIQKIIANTEKGSLGEYGNPIEYYQILTVTPDVESIPSVSRINPNEPLFSIHDVIASVQNVLKSEIKIKQSQSSPQFNNSNYLASAASDHIEILTENPGSSLKAEVQKVTSSNGQQTPASSVTSKTETSEPVVATTYRPTSQANTILQENAAVTSETGKLKASTPVPTTAKPVPSSETPKPIQVEASPSTLKSAEVSTSSPIPEASLSLRETLESAASTNKVISNSPAKVPATESLPLLLSDAHPGLISNDTFLDMKPVTVEEISRIAEPIIEELKASSTSNQAGNFVKVETVERDSVPVQAQSQPENVPETSTSKVQIPITPDLAESVSSVLWQIASENSLLDGLKKPTEPTTSPVEAKTSEGDQTLKEVEEVKTAPSEPTTEAPAQSRSTVKVEKLSENPLTTLQNILRTQNRPRPFQKIPIIEKGTPDVVESKIEPIPSSTSTYEQPSTASSTVETITQAEVVSSTSKVEVNSTVLNNTEQNNKEQPLPLTNAESTTANLIVSVSPDAVIQSPEQLKPLTSQIVASKDNSTGAQNQTQQNIEGVEVIQEGNVGQIPRTTEFPGQVVKEIQRMENPETEENLSDSASNTFSTQLPYTELETTTILDAEGKTEKLESENVEVTTISTEVGVENKSSDDEVDQKESFASERVDITFVPMVIKTPSEFKQEEASLKSDVESKENITTTEKSQSDKVTEQTEVYSTDPSNSTPVEENLESKELPESTSELKSEPPKSTTEVTEQKETVVADDLTSEPDFSDIGTLKQNIPNKPQFGKPQKPVYGKPIKTKPQPKPSATAKPAKEQENKKPYENHLQSSPSVLELDAAPDENLGLEATVANLDEDIKRFSDLCNELAFSLWSSVTHNGLSFVRSVVVSPFAVTSLLAMVFLGARGPTSGQMNDVLKLDEMVTFNPHLVFRNVTESLVISRNPGVATTAFVRELYSDKSKGKLLDFYKERVQQFYDGHVEEVNFKTIGDTLRRQTNHLVKRQTWGKITDFLRGSNLMPRPPLAAFSANIFQTDCSRASTKDRDGEMYFVILPASRLRRLVPIPAVVWRDSFLAGYEPNLDATAVSITPSDSAVSTIFVLPGQQGLIAPGDTLARLEHHLLGSSYKKGHWSRLMRSLLPRPGLELQIPRLSHKSVINVTSSLQRMGLKDLFSADKADLTGLNGLANDLHLSDMLQVNLFSTCGEEPIGARHHSEIYPATPILRREKSADNVFSESIDNLFAISDFEDPAISALPLELRPRQARVPLSKPGARIPEPPRLRFDRPFLFFVRHNPTGLILHMGRFNPRLMP